MDMLDQALDSSQDKTNDSVTSDEPHQVHLGSGEPIEEQGAAIASVSGQGINLDPNVQYQFRTDTNNQGDYGQVTYRVVQVSPDGEATAQVVTSSAFPAGAQVAQAVIQSPFSNGNSPQEDPNTETRFAYFPTATGPTDASVTQAQDVTTATAIGPVTAAGGQFYVMMSPQDVLQGQRNIAPRTSFSPKIEGRTARDDRRRATHNEVERRRRDKINNWIVQLSKLVPDCSQEQTKQGQIIGSKGGILSKACDYITELRTQNARMGESMKETERLQVDTELLRQQCEELKAENNILRASLSQHGIIIQDMSGNPS